MCLLKRQSQGTQSRVITQEHFPPNITRKIEILNATLPTTSGTPRLSTLLLIFSQHIAIMFQERVKLRFALSL